MQQDLAINCETNYQRSQELTSPHFDDELTIASARAVVPLEEITHQRTRRGWVLAGAFALSLLLGAGSALLAIRMKRQFAQPVSAEAIVDEPQQDEPFEIQGGDATRVATKVEATDSEQLQSSVQQTDAHPIQARAKSPQKPAKRVAQASNRESRPIQKPVPLPQIPTAVLIDQWQERRQRRALRQERRDRRSQRTQDAFRIDEIFEGTRRPS
jgi:hypothetical protein